MNQKDLELIVRVSVANAKNINKKFMRKIVKGSRPFLPTRFRTFSSSHKFTCFPNIFDIFLPLKTEGKIEDVSVRVEVKGSKLRILLAKFQIFLFGKGA